MNKRILLFGAAREHSTRCADKMTRHFAERSLFGIYLDHLKDLNAIGLFTRHGVAVARCDETLWAEANASGVPIIERDAQSVAPEIQPRGRELHFLDQFDEEFVLYYNACMPLFPTEWIKVAVENFVSRPEVRSLTPVTVEHDWFWWPDGMAVNNRDPECLSTQGAPRVFRSVHAFNVYPRTRMLRENVRWRSRPGDPEFYYVHDVNGSLLDIDTEEDFRRCEREWLFQKGKEDENPDADR